MSLPSLNHPSGLRQIPFAGSSSVLGKRASASSPREESKRPLKRRDTGDQHNLVCKVEFIAKELLGDKIENKLAQGPLPVITPQHFSAANIGGQGVVTFVESGRRSPLAVKRFYGSHRKSYFRREYSALKLADGPAHGVHMRGVITIEGSKEKALVMDRINGKNLKEIITAGQKFSECGVLKLIKNILECLRDIQSKGMIHSDIKPENIVYDNKNNRFVLVDFGSCTKFEGKKECGTLGYYSPEECLGIKSDYSNDIWSLGCAAFFACTGKKLFNMHNSYLNFSDCISVSLVNIEKVIGEVPVSIISEGSESRRVEFLKNRDYLKSIRIAPLEKEMKNFPKSLKTLIGSMLSYDRPSVNELLRNKHMQEDIGIRLDYPDRFMGYDLEIEPEEKLEDSISSTDRVKFSLSAKESRKICHHVPRSQNDKYSIKLTNSNGHVIFEDSGREIHERGMLELTDIGE